MSPAIWLRTCNSAGGRVGKDLGTVGSGCCGGSAVGFGGSVSTLQDCGVLGVAGLGGVSIPFTLVGGGDGDGGEKVKSSSNGEDKSSLCFCGSGVLDLV